MNPIIEKLKHLPDDRISDGIYIAYEWSFAGSERNLIRLYIGSKECGPMLQYTAPYERLIETETKVTIMELTTEVNINTLYNGKEWVHFLSGAWTNLYSRGDFGKKFAFGGHWTNHAKHRHPRIADGWSPNNKTKQLLALDEGIEVLPEGIKGNVGVTEMDLQGGWTIFFSTASEALSNRLTVAEIMESDMSNVTKKHLYRTQTYAVMENLKDVINTYLL